MKDKKTNADVLNHISTHLLMRIVVGLLLVVLALVSIGKVAPVTTDMETHEEEIARLDAEIDMVLKLTAGAAGASAVISLLPDDQCTPIANELAELAKYFLIVLSALYLEKYLITIMGHVAFVYLIPLALACWGIGFFANRGNFRGLGYKLGICAMAIYIMIPASVRVSEYIYTNYETSIESTIDEANRISVTEESEDATLIEKITGWIEQAAVTVTQYVTDLLANFVDALAVMVVTSCLIPLLVVVFFTWLIKILFGVQIPSLGGPKFKLPMPNGKPLDLGDDQN